MPRAGGKLIVEHLAVVIIERLTQIPRVGEMLTRSNAIAGSRGNTRLERGHEGAIEIGEVTRVFREKRTCFIGEGTRRLNPAEFRVDPRHHPCATLMMDMRAHLKPVPEACVGPMQHQMVFRRRALRFFQEIPRAIVKRDGESAVIVAHGQNFAVT